MYWPYDEVSLDVQLDLGWVAVKTPWMEATLPTEVLSIEELTTLSAKLNEQTLSVDHLPLINRFFTNLEAYPFAYTLPIPKESRTPDQHVLKDDALLLGSMQEVFEKILALSTGDVDFRATDVSLLFDKLSRSEWQWDLDAALLFAGIDNRVHPESLFSVAKRFHLLEIMSSDRGNDIFQNVRQMNDDGFKKAAACLVRQNHYVTQQCQRALEPAVATAQSARELVLQFQKEEKGHDKLLERALLAMGETPKDIPVSLPTKALMVLLEFCAQRNFLAFCMAVDAFERSNYAQTDPLAQLLKSRNLNEAAKYINAHMNINDHGEHENVAKKFIFAMDLCSDAYAREALRLMELLSLVMCSVSSTPI